METVSNKVVGTLEYYGPNGTIADSITYTDPQKFKQDLECSLYCGKPLTATVYTRPGQGPAVSVQWFIDRVSNMSARYKVQHCPGRRAKKTAQKKTKSRRIYHER